MSEPAVEMLARRLDRLETEVRRWRIIGGLLVVMIATAGVLAAAPTTVPDEIRAKNFVVVGDKGQRRALLGEEPLSGVGLRVYGADGGSRLSLMVRHLSDDLPFVEMRDKNPGWARFVAELRGNAAAPSVKLLSRPSEKLLLEGSKGPIMRAELGLGATGQPFVEFRSGDKTTTALLTESGIGFHTGRSDAVFGVDSGEVALSIYDVDPGGNRTIRSVLGEVTLSTERTGTREMRQGSSLVLFDRDGTVIWKVP